MALTAGERRLVPARLLAALRWVGMPEAEIRGYYRIPPDEPLPEGAPESLQVEDMELLPDDSYHYELWQGKLVRMCATKRVHGGTAGRVTGYLMVYLFENPIGSVYVADVGFRAGPGESLYCPDAAFVTTEREAGVGEQFLARKPGQCSGGQRQRAALVRALAGNPDVLLADEPTSALDRSTAEVVLGLVNRRRAAGLAVLLVTHDETLAGQADRVVDVVDGRCVERTRQ